MRSTIDLVSRPDAVAPALDALEARLTEAGLASELALEMRLLGEEALTNVVKYAAARSIELAVEVTENEIVLELRDDGRPFDPLNAAPPELGASLEARRLGGLGIHLMRSLSDEASYARSGDSNVLRLTKKRL